MTAIMTETEVQAWLAGRIVAYGKKTAGEFTIDSEFTDLGLDSVYALTR
jgi:acyl carrier protein